VSDLVRVRRFAVAGVVNMLHNGKRTHEYTLLIHDTLHERELDNIRRGMRTESITQSHIPKIYTNTAPPNRKPI